MLGVVLGDVGCDVEPHDERHVSLRPDYLLQKLDRGALLKLEALTDRGAGINHDSNPQWQVGLLREIENLGRSLLVVQQSKVSLLQVWDKSAVLVSDGEDQVHLIDVGLDGEIVVVLPIGGRLSRR